MFKAKFSEKSDVWSWACLAIEVYTGGKKLFSTVSNADLPLCIVQDKLVPERPGSCPQKVYNLLQKCFAQSPEERPTFSQIVRRVKKHFPAEKEAVAVRKATSASNDYTAFPDPGGADPVTFADFPDGGYVSPDAATD